MITKKEIEKYVKERKGNSVGKYTDGWGNKRIYFRNNETGRFTGHIAENKDSITAIKRYIPVKAKIKVKIKGERGKKTLIYNIYNKKQQREIIFRMNKKLRVTQKYKTEQKTFGLDSKTKREDAVPYLKGKTKIDLLFDRYKFEPAIIDKFEGFS
jgi:hypothetical protein